MRFAPNNPEAVKSVADVWFICALAERDAAAAEMALSALGDATFGDNSTQFNAAFGRGLLARMMKDENKSALCFRGDSSGAGKDRAGAARLWPGSLHPCVD